MRRMNTSTPQTPPVWLPAAKVAAELGVKPRTLLMDAEAGRLPFRVTRFGQRGSAHVLSADVQAYLRELHQHPAQGIV